MDPITIGALTITVGQLVSWGISTSSTIISNVHTWINERKRKKTEAERLLALQDHLVRHVYGSTSSWPHVVYGLFSDRDMEGVTLACYVDRFT